MDKLPTTRSKHLGLTYTPQASTFKLWSPTADKVAVNLYQTGSRKENTLLKSIPMTASKTLWTATIKEDLQGLFYTYAITRGEETVETVDLYAKAVGLNGDRGAIIDLATTDPSGWHLDCPPKELTGKLTDASSGKSMLPILAVPKMPVSKQVIKENTSLSLKVLAIYQISRIFLLGWLI